MATRWTDADTDTLRDLHAQDLTAGQIAKRTGWSPSQIARRAKRLGLTWDRSRTMAATEANLRDGRARRAALEQRLLDEAEKSLDRLWSPMEVGAFGGVDGGYHRATVDEPSPADRKAIMQTVSTATAAAAKLAEQNAGTEVDAAKGAMTRMLDALKGATPE